MTASPWLPFAVGSIVTLGSVAFFLYSLWLGLNRRRWWPLGVIVFVWIVMMAAYSFWDSGSTAQGSRQRIQSAIGAPTLRTDLLTDRTGATAASGVQVAPVEISARAPGRLLW